MAYIVSAPLVITKREDGADMYLYDGAEVPSFVKDDELKRLEDRGFLTKVDGRSAKAAKPTSESN